MDPFDDETDAASDNLIVSFCTTKVSVFIHLRLHYGTSAVLRAWTSRLYIVRKSQSEDSTVLPTLTG